MKKILIITAASFMLNFTNPCVPIVNYSGCYLEVVDWQLYNSYQWYRNALPIGGAVSWSYEPLEPGSYTVKVTSPDGCMGVSKRIKVISWCGTGVR